jgi:hypothetical protein
MRRKFAIIFTLVVVSCCASCTGNAPPTVDLGGRDLDVKISLVDDVGYSDLYVAMQFFKNSHAVQVTGRASCVSYQASSTGRYSIKTVELTWNPDLTVYEGTVPESFLNYYSFEYLHTSETTRATVPQESLVITSPIDRHEILRNANFSIAYNSASYTSHDHESKSIVSGSAEDSRTSMHGSPESQRDNGTYVGIDASALHGDGQVRLTRHLEGSLPHSGFKSARYTYDITSHLLVYWG